MRKLIIPMIITLTVGFASCHKIVEHTCTCRNYEGNITESTKYYGSKDSAADECSKKADSLNAQGQTVEHYTCTLD